MKTLNGELAKSHERNTTAGSPDVLEIEQALKNSGCRMTRQRRIILQHLSEHEGHPSASQIFQDLTKVEPKVGVATVYNTLGVLTRLGYLKVLEFDSHENRYETNLEPHINLICRSCGKILDMPNSWPLEETVAENMQGFSVSDTRFECYGQCPACQSHKEGN